MSKHDFGSSAGSQERKAHRVEDGKIQYSLRAEEQLLRLISTRVPLAMVLNEICSALDCQIGNVVSLIALPSDNPAELDEIAGNAMLFGLHTFCSECVAAGKGQVLGSLEMYSCDSRTPTASEWEWIERAKCLAAIAIQRHEEQSQHCDTSVPGGRQVRGRVIEWPTTTH
jgi:hypothetical protein